MSIITVTLNPAIDQTIQLEQLTVGEVHRAQSVHYTAGGKGIMVASCLADWFDEPIVVTGLLGNENIGIFEAMFDYKGMDDQFIRVPGLNRTNIKIVDHDCTTDINLPGIAASEAALTQMMGAVAQDYEIAILSGSIPPLCQGTIYAEILEALSAHQTKVIVDASGVALKAALASSVKPYCVKPNFVELSEYAGRTLTTEAEVIEEAKKLLTSGIRLVVISMGGDGALFIDDTGVIKANLIAPKVMTTVGAGDAMVAGIASALREHASLERIARLATAFAVSKLGSIGPNLPEHEVVEAFAVQVTIQTLEVSS
ncbi:1-phosphofructokinase [Wohlfahrtiimonas sp. G9077]|uniref:1-phosphofructokinase n=1 Tax=Wohlfahrtiimonas sp. G9077 TaxID=1980118 RepID=UPI000B98CD9F|nr:1-phosphofructokinase [Wohlfahrtiimonas sp. G9077]OYQ75567.1 1-phosphofructokinase [Wohlfahrtiimonas sp. G9077]